MNCCDAKPVIGLHDGRRFCKGHFKAHFEEKVLRTIREFNLLERQEKVGVALSGGKDSLTVLHLLAKLSGQNPKISVQAIAINEGIAGYREKTMQTALDYCKENGIMMHVFSYKEEFGYTLDEMLKVLNVRPCIICGIFRRYLINMKSRELGFTKLATGHNMDDECQTILMNQFKNNIRASARLGPKAGIINEGMFIQRIKPLYFCTEREVTAYAFINGLLDGFSECPNAVNSFRAEIRDMLNSMEQKFPGTKHSLVNSFIDTLPMLKEKMLDDIGHESLKLCSRCGEPCSKELCNACIYVDKLAMASKSQFSLCTNL